MQILNFDLSTKNIAPVLNVKQGDVGRKFKAVIMDGGVAYSIPAGAQFSVWYSGTSGEGNYSAIGERSAFAVEGNTVVVELIVQMVQNAGTGAMCLVLNAADGSQLGLWNLIYAVEHVPGMGSKAAEDYYTALSELARQAIDAAATFETDPGLSISGKAADADAVGTALAGKAPAGYGLGEELKQVSNLNAYEAVVTGRYRFSIDCTNRPEQIHYGVVDAFYRTPTEIAQVVIGVGNMSIYMDGIVAERYTNDGGVTWSEWAYRNPPMVEGAVYRTTERSNGHPVYAHRMYCGAFPNSTYKTFDISWLGAKGVVRQYARMVSNGGGADSYTLPYFGNGGVCSYWINVRGINVYQGADNDASAYDGYVDIYFIKD